MPERDITEKYLESYNDVFADIVNVLLFNGRRRVLPDDLRDTKARTLYKADGKLREQERDVSKVWAPGGTVISLIGFENQTRMDRDMPLRVLGYEGADYRNQLSAQGGLYPVVTLVLYFGEEPWTAPRSLYERVHVPEELRPFVSDHGINVFEISFLTDEQTEWFTSDFRIVADYFVQMRRNGDYVPSRRVIEHVDGVLKLLSALTRDNRFEEAQNQFREEESVTMLSVLDKVEARGIQLGEARGIQLGRTETARNLLRMGLEPAKVAEAASLTLEEVDALRGQAG